MSARRPPSPMRCSTPPASASADCRSASRTCWRVDATNASREQEPKQEPNKSNELFANRKVLFVLVGPQYLGPFADLALEIAGEEIRSGRARHEHADVIEPLAHIGIGERRAERGIEPVDHLLGRALRGIHA